MPNAKTHFIVGGIASTLTYCIIKNLNNEPIIPLHAVGYGFLGGIAALAPDILEPANSPFHREFFHSEAVLLGVGYAGANLHSNPTLTPNQKDILTAITIGYGSHLLLDAATPAGLPDI